MRTDAFMLWFDRRFWHLFELLYFILQLSVDEAVSSFHPPFKKENGDTPGQEAPCPECLHSIDCTLQEKNLQSKPTYSDNSCLKPLSPTVVAISPKDSDRQSPAKHDHSTKSPFLFLYHFVKRSESRKMSISIFSPLDAMAGEMFWSYVVCALL